MQWLAWAWIVAMGCSSTSEQGPRAPSDTGPSSRQAQVQHLTYNRVALLQAQVQALSVPQVASSDGRTLVLRLAHAQTCLSIHTESPELAEATIELIDAYRALLVDQHGKLRRYVVRSLDGAARDAQAATQPDADLMSESCRRYAYRPRRSRRTRASSPTTMKNAWGIDAHRGFNGQNSIPGGVVR